MTSQRFAHPAFATPIDVWSKTHQGVLNFGLDLKHFLAVWDAMGEKEPDPSAGFFPTLESLEARAQGVPPRDGLANVRAGLTTHVRPITLTAGKVIFRFAQQTRAGGALNVPGEIGGDLDWALFCGPWWTTALGFENMLARVGATYERSAIGVAGGQGMTLREYARRYSAVLSDWSRMEMVGMCQQHIFEMLMRG